MEIFGWILIGLGSLTFLVVLTTKIIIFSSKWKKAETVVKAEPKSFFEKNLNYFMYFIPILIIVMGLVINFGDIKL